MSEFKTYRKTAVQEMRPYIPGEPLAGISVSPEDTPEAGGMIARNAINHADQWYVAKAFFESSYVPVLDGENDTNELLKTVAAELDAERAKIAAMCMPAFIDFHALGTGMPLEHISKQLDRAACLSVMAADKLTRALITHTVR